MRILHVVQYMAPLMGGPPASISVLAEGLIKRGHEVTICTTDYCLNKKDIRDLRAKGIKLKIFRHWFGRLYYCPSAKEYLNQNIKRFDIVHLNNHWSYLNIVAHNYCREYNVPYVFSARGSFPIRQLGSRNFLLKQIYRYLWGKSIARDSAKLIALSDLEVMQYLTRAPSKQPIVKIPNPISPEVANKAKTIVVFDPIKLRHGHCPKKHLFIRRYGISDAEKVILYVGRLNRRKGVDLLIRSFALLCNKIKNVKLLIVGPDDGFLPKLKSITKRLNLENKIIFTGPLFDDNKIQVYKEADIFVSPSIREPFGVALVEAMAFGLPIVSVKDICLADIVRDKSALLVNYNEKELCRAILKILSDGNLRRRMGKAAKKIAKQFDYRKIAKQMEGVYLDAIKISKKKI